MRPARFQTKRISEATLRRLYLDKRLPIAVIAAYFGVAVSTISNARQRYNIPARPRRAPPPDADSAEP